MVGETGTGEPVFEIRSVRLVLAGNGTHFTRVAACARCGRDLPGAAVLSPADLDLTPRPVICKDCVSTAGSLVFETDGRRPLAPAPPLPDASVEAPVTAEPAASTIENARLAALEQALADLSERFSSLITTGNGVVDELDSSRTAEEVVRLILAGDELRRASHEVRERLGHVAERLTEESEWGRARVQDLQERMEGVNVAVEAGSSLAQSHTSGLAQMRDDLTRVEAGLEERLQGLVEDAATQRSVLRSTLEGRIDQVREALEQEAARTGADAAQASEELARAEGELRLGLEGMTGRLDQLQAGLDAGLARVESESARVARVKDDLDRVEARLAERLEGLVDGVLAQRSDLESTMQARIDELQAALEHEAARTGAAAVQATEELARAQSELRLGLETMSERLEHMRVSIDDGVVRSQSGSEALERAYEELARLGEQLNERLDRLAERAVRSAEADDERLHAVEQLALREAGRLAQALESQKADLQSEVRDGLAELRSAIPEAVAGNAQRLHALEDRAARTAGLLSEIEELLAILDRGFGELRGEIVRLRDADTRPITPSAPVDSEFDTVDTHSIPVVETEPGGKRGRKSAAKAHRAAVAAATEELALKQRRLEVQVTTLERTLEATVKAVARAASHAAALGPLRSEVEAVRENVVAHDDTLVKLRRTLDDLRRRTPDPPPATRPTPKKRAPRTPKG